MTFAQQSVLATLQQTNYATSMLILNRHGRSHHLIAVTVLTAVGYDYSEL